MPYKPTVTYIGRQAILCKYLPSTNTKGSRVKAYCVAGSITGDYHALSSEAGDKGFHSAFVGAAKRLLAKLGWGGEWIGTTIDGGTRYIFVDKSEKW